MGMRVLFTRAPVMGALALATVVVLSLPAIAGATPPGDNGRIAFVSDRDGNYEIYSMNPDGSDVVRLTNDSGEDWGPAWSPDGTKIAFSSTRGGTTHDVYVMNADGTGVTQLTEDAATDWTPNWSPDGTQIAFESTRTGGGDIYKMNADGSSETRLTEDVQSDAGPAWSPDGSKIAFRSLREDYWEIFTMDTGGVTETELPHWDFKYEVELSWKPDGSTLVYQNNPPGLPNIEVFTVPMTGPDPGTPRTNISNNSATDGYVSWSPNGGRIAFASDRDGDFEIHTMSPTGGSVTQVTSNAFDEFDPDWQRLYHVRPLSASPFRASLVPAYVQCTTANNTHGAPAAYPSCSPPAQESSYLTLGTPNANGQAPQGTGSVVVQVINVSLPTEDDQFTVSLTDVRCRTTSGGCAGAMEDYTGDVLVSASMRITDRYNGAALNDPGTVYDIPFSFGVSCSATGTPGLPNAIGSSCATVTTANALIPGFVKFGQRQIIQLGQMKVFDGGPDGSAATNDNLLFQIQGIFNP